MDFKIIWHSCSLLGVEVPFERCIATYDLKAVICDIEMLSASMALNSRGQGHSVFSGLDKRSVGLNI